MYTVDDMYADHLDSLHTWGGEFSPSEVFAEWLNALEEDSE